LSFGLARFRQALNKNLAERGGAAKAIRLRSPVAALPESSHIAIHQPRFELQAISALNLAHDAGRAGPPF